MSNKQNADKDDILSLVEGVFFDLLSSPDVWKAVISKAIPYVISDERQKRIKILANKDGPLTDDELSELIYTYGKGEGNLDPSAMDDWTDDMVQEYADNLRNFLYQYKESATSIDPRIDHEEYHRGPMAQDIEKVAPDCVKETPEGVKTVDGNRLALVNAGVIGDLARRLIALEDKLGVGGN